MRLILLSIFAYSAYHVFQRVLAENEKAPRLALPAPGKTFAATARARSGKTGQRTHR